MSSQIRYADDSKREGRAVVSVVSAVLHATNNGRQAATVAAVADHAGADPETLCRVLWDLAGHGLLRIDGSRVEMTAEERTEEGEFLAALETAIAASSQESRHRQECVERARVLWAFLDVAADLGDPSSARVLAATTGLPHATCTNHLLALALSGVLSRDHTGRRFFVWDLSEAALRRAFGSNAERALAGPEWW